MSTGINGMSDAVVMRGGKRTVSTGISGTLFL